MLEPNPHASAPAKDTGEAARVEAAAKALPALRARLRGAFAYICPECSRIEKVSYINRRLPHTQCRGCKRKWGVGIAGFRLKFADTSIAAGRFLLEGYHGQAARDQLFNTLGVVCERVPEPDAVLLGQIQGPVEWICPACGVRGKDDLDKDGCVACPCGERLAMRLRLWGLTQGRRWALPADHVL